MEEIKSACFDTATDNIYFNRYFTRFFRAFLCLVTIYLIILTFNILRNNPIYMLDWHGPTCILLSLILLTCYSTPVLLSPKKWPPSLSYSLTAWLSAYFATTLLSLINPDFSWDFYIVFGLSFALFEARRLLLTVAFVAVAMLTFQGLLTWPPSADHLAGLVGETLALFSMVGFSLLTQRLIAERYKRNRLLQQLTEANASLEEAHLQLTQSVEQNQELAVLRERTRLAREMHDTLGHALVLISVKLEAAQRLRERDPERCERELESTKEVARESMTALRASIANLRSPALEREHIYPALGRFTKELAHRTGLHITNTLQADIERLPEPVEETLWKICLEALTNIEKHAHASHVELSITCNEKKLLLSVRDDGIGLPQELRQFQEDGSLIDTIHDGHYGVRGMFERVEGIGGHFSIYSSQGQGTTIKVAVPLPQEDDGGVKNGSDGDVDRTDGGCFWRTGL